MAGSNSVELACAQPANVARELDHHGLHAQADAEIRHLVLARIADGVAACPPCRACRIRPEPECRRSAPAAAAHSGHSQLLRFDPVDVHLQPVRQPAVQQRFLQALVGILVLHVLADQPDLHLVLGILHPLEHLGPARSDRAARDSRRQQAQNDLVHASARRTPAALRRRDFTSLAVITASTSTSQNSAIFSFMSSAAAARSGTAECRAEYRWRAVPSRCAAWAWSSAPARPRSRAPA